MIEWMPIVLTDFNYYENIAEKGLKTFSILLTLWIVRSVLNALKDYFKTLPKLKDKPIDSYIQVFMIFAWVIGVFSAIAILTGIAFINFIKLNIMFSNSFSHFLKLPFNGCIFN